MNFALVLICSLTASLTSVCIRFFQDKLQRQQKDLQLFQFGYIFLDAVAYLILAGFVLPSGGTAWLLALLFAVCLALSSIGLAESYMSGPMSLTSVIVSCNVILPIIVGCIFYDETMGVVHWIGCILLLATLILSGIGPKEEKREISPKWYLMVLLCFLGNGFGAVILNAYGKLYAGAGNNSFLGVSFLIAAVMLLAYVLSGRSQQPAKQTKLPPLFFVLVTAAAAGCFGTNILLLHLTGSFPASLLYPVYNGASTVVLCVVSCLVFRESINAKKLLTILLGIGAVILLNL